MIDVGGEEFTIDPAAPTLRPKKPEPPPPPPPAPIAVVSAAGGETAQPTDQPTPPIAPAPQAEADEVDAQTVGRLTQLCAFAEKILAWLWRWLRESWSVYERYDGSYNVSFHRWPHVLVAAALGIAFFVHRAAPGLLAEVAANINPPLPAPVWTKRSVRDFGIESGGWVLYPRSLKSSGSRYRFTFGLGNQDSYDYGVCAASIQDTRGRALASRTWREVLVQRGYRLAKDQTFEFAGPRGMDRFFVVISDNQAGCGKTSQDKSFLVQFD